MPELEWTELARDDLLAIIGYISDDNPDAAQRLKDHIEAQAASLSEFPRLYRAARIEGAREMLVWANYVVVYSESSLAVRILRVLHAAQQWPPAAHG